MQREAFLERCDALKRHVVRVQRVHAMHDRGDKLLHDGLTHASTHKRAERNVSAFAKPRNQRIELSAKSAAHTNHRDGVLVERRRWDTKNAGGGQGQGRAIHGLKPRTFVARRHNVIAEAQLASEVGNSIAAGGEAFGSDIQIDSTDEVGCDGAAEMVACLNEAHGPPRHRESTRSNKPCDAATDDGEFCRAHAHYPSW